ncbi:hypothetical protein [Microcystis aeruginosa]|nr:hypothetical protein [Microcystis aeruginosa]WNF14913.1 hypothetical protein RKE53_00135 [Microcystis aeruginosa NRERC-214]
MTQRYVDSPWYGKIWAFLKQRQFKNETHQPQELTKKGSSGTV